MKNGPDKKDWFPEFKEGSHPAFRHYFELHYQLLFYAAYRIVNDKAGAEDVVSDAFRKLWENRDRIQTEDHILAFLRITTRHIGLNYRKREERKTAGQEEWRYLNEDLEKADFANDLIAAELARRIRDAIEKLPPQCKAVFKMIYFEQASTKEVAARLQITERNVLNQKSRAVLLLKGMLTLEIILLKILLSLPG